MGNIMRELVREDLIELSRNADNQSQLLHYLSETLFEKGYVHDGFLEAIVERENEFPTGLQLENTAVAIPHTYAEYVKKPFIYFNKLVKPVEFVQMGTDDEIVLANYVIVLGISEPKNQTGLLVELMESFGDLEFLKSLQSVESIEEVVNLLSK